MIRYALRTLRKSPGYTAACITLLALGIGANTAIFSLVYSVVLKPLPYPDADRLVFAWQKFPDLPEPFRDRVWPSRLLYNEWREHANGISDLAAFLEMPLPETGVERPRRIRTEFVSANLLPLLGARPTIGRLFRPDEEQPGQDRVVLLSSAYFEKRFQNNPQALGKTVALDGVDYTVVGVLPARFRMPASYVGENRDAPEAFVPLSRRWGKPEDDTNTILNVAAKLGPGVALEQARAELSAISARLHASDYDRFPALEASMFSFKVEDQPEDLSQALFVLLGAVGLVLLIACANLANLTLARATLRAREIAIRRAMGASRARIVAHLLSESFVLSVAGSLAGLFLAVWIVDGFRALMPSDLQRPDMGDLSLPVFAFGAAASILTTLLFGLIPAIAASRTSVNTALKAGGRTASAAGARSRQILTALEVAMALVLLFGAGLLIRSFDRVVKTGIGFDTRQLAVVDVELPEARYKDAASRSRFLNNLLASARNIPGVKSAAITDTLPMHAVRVETFFRADRPEPTQGNYSVTDLANITPGYLEMLGVPVVAGRGMTADDEVRNRGKGDGVILVNRSFVDTYLSGEDPLKIRLMLDGGDRAYQIVGVVANFRAMGADEPVRPQYFKAGADGARSILVLRTVVPPESIADDSRALLWSLDKDLVIANVGTMAYYVDESLKLRWFGLILLAVFAGLALLLAMIGVYSVLANLVASRTREIGIRMALGAAPSIIGRMIAAQSLRPILAGLVIGIGASVALGRVLDSMLFEVTSRDPLTLTLAVAGVLLMTPLAILVPLRRATRVECTEALREE